MIGNLQSSPCLSGAKHRPTSWQWESGNWIVVEAAAAIDLVVQGAAQAHTAEGPSLQLATDLATQDATHSHQAEAPSLAVVLSVGDSTHDHSAEVPNLLIIFIQNVDDTYHVHSPEQVYFAIPLTPLDAAHVHGSDQPGIQQAHILTASEALHGHQADSPGLVPTIAVADSTHEVSADVVSLGDIIAVNDATHGISSTQPTMVVIIAVNEALQAQLADNVGLATGGTLEVDDVIHGITSDHDWVIYGELVMTILELYNTALGLLGHDTISDVDDSTKAGRFLNLLWPTVRKTVLRSHPWNIARKRVLLDTPDSTSPAFEWAYRFGLPSDCLRVLGRLDSDEPWLVEGNFVLTNTTSIALRYIADVTDPAAYDSLLTEAMYTCLAAKLALPLAGSKELSQMLDVQFQDILNSARHVDATESFPPRVVTDDWERSRG